MIKLKPTSWKIMLEVLVKGNPTRVVEVPIQFMPREAGESKFSAKQAMLYFKHLVLLMFYKHKDTGIKMSKFGAIGASGMAIHFPLLYVLTDVAGLWYVMSAIISIAVTATSNYILNHKFTFKDRSIKNHAVGWTKYQILSATTDALYVGMLALFVEVAGLWYILGALISMLILFPLKYKIASSLIWRKERNAEAGDYDWQNFYKGGMLQKRWKQAIANVVWVWIPASDRLLNVGCGSSPIAIKYPESTNVDTNKDKLAYLKERLPDVSVAESQAEKLPFGDAQFSDVICVEMIEHSHQPKQVIREIARVLKPEGAAVITTPDYGKVFWHLAKGIIGAEKDHVAHFTKDSLEIMCRKQGLFPVEHKYVASCDLCVKFVKVGK